MSWGYFLELNLTLPTVDWDTLQRITSAELSPQWWGFEEAGLEHTFGNAGFENAMFHKVFKFWTHGQSCVKEVVEDGDLTSVHLILHLDKSGDTQVAGTLAAMVEAAAKVGGTGRIRLVNDGSYSGEDGVEVAIDDGRLVRSKIDGSNEIADELGAAVYPEMAEEIERYLSPEAKAPSTKAKKQPVAKKSKPNKAKQPAAKKKPAGKQPAAKKKPAGKKQPAAKKTPAAKKKPKAKQKR
jgi:hypothetical protein